MSTHYLIDATTPVLLNSEINDVRHVGVFEQTTLGGNFVIRLADDVSIGPVDPVDLTDLLTKKYIGLLASHPLYTNIAVESFVSAPGVDLVNSSAIAVGDRCTTTLLGVPAVFQSSMATLAASPTQALIIIETFYNEAEDPIGDRGSRAYTELDPSVGTCDVSFDNGSTFLTTTSGALLNIPVPNQGSQFIFRFTGTFANLSMGSWAVIY
jgi:hypothetical protein